MVGECFILCETSVSQDVFCVSFVRIVWKQDNVIAVAGKHS